VKAVRFILLVCLTIMALCTTYQVPTEYAAIPAGISSCLFYLCFPAFDAMMDAHFEDEL